MPRYIDYHEVAPPMPPEAIQMMQGAIKAGKADEFGVTALNAMMGGGHAWCLTDAPSLDAVCESHGAKGMLQTAGNVTEVQAIA